jgi:hypothetical protein
MFSSSSRGFLFLSFSLTHSSCWRPVILHYRLLVCAQSLFCFGGGWPLHKVQFLIVCIPLQIQIVCFQISSPRVFLRVLLHSLLRCSCSLGLGFLVPLLHSGAFHNLSPSFRRFGVPCFAWVLVRSFLMNSPLHRATAVLWVIPLQAATNCFRGPHFILFRSSVKNLSCACLAIHGTIQTTCNHNNYSAIAISTLYKPPQHPLSLFHPAVS